MTTNPIDLDKLNAAVREISAAEWEPGVAVVTALLQSLLHDVDAAIAEDEGDVDAMLDARTKSLEELLAHGDALTAIEQKFNAGVGVCGRP